MRRDLGAAVVAQVARDVRASIEYAPGASRGRPGPCQAVQPRAIGDDRTDRFVGMYVNEWTVDYGPRRPPGGADAARPGRATSGFVPRVSVDFAG